MADKRMFAKTIIDSDTFLEMPISARLLYYDLGMRADDDGFVDSPKKIMRIVGASTDDMNILIARKFIIPFDSGIVVIRHWRINNYLRSDRYCESIHIDEKSQLAIDDNKQYLTQNEADSLGIPLGIPVVGVEENSKEKKRKDNKDSVHQKEISDFFESIWQLYPKKKGKNSVSKKSKEELFKLGYENVKSCIERYIEDSKFTDEQYILYGSTFFNGRYKDYLEEEQQVNTVVEKTQEEIEEDEWANLTDDEWLEKMKALDEEG